MQRFLAVMLMLMPIVASCGPQQPDLAQLTRMRTETADARVLESVGCTLRDWVCAEIVALRGEACAELANQTNRFPPQRQAELRACALKDARRLPGLLPSGDSASSSLSNDAPARIRQEAALAIFDGWRGALGANDPAVDPAGLEGAANDLRAIPGGEPLRRHSASRPPDQGGACRAGRWCLRHSCAGACDIAVGAARRCCSRASPSNVTRPSIFRESEGAAHDRDPDPVPVSRLADDAGR